MLKDAVNLRLPSLPENHSVPELPVMIHCSSRRFGTLPGGLHVTSWTLRNRNGMEVEILNHGAIIRRISYPMPSGEPLDVVLGYNDLEGYLQDQAWIGAVAGRVAGRITGGRLDLDGTHHQLPVNNPPNHLHGGTDSFHRKLWRFDATGGENTVRLIHSSPHGDQGFPGDVIVAVTYALTDDDELVFTTEAVSLEATPVSVTQHSYFNLAGEGRGNTLDHLLGVFSDVFIPIAEDYTLSDRRLPVAGTPADLRNPKTLRSVVPETTRQHLDLYWFGDARGTKHMARLFSPESGIQMDVFSTLECLQLYSAADLGGGYPGKSGSPYQAFSGVCLEVEGYPNACNATGFGSILTEPGKVRKHVTTYAFRHGVAATAAL